MEIKNTHIKRTLHNMLCFKSVPVSKVNTILGPWSTVREADLPTVRYVYTRARGAGRRVTRGERGGGDDRDGCSEGRRSAAILHNARRG